MKLKIFLIIIAILSFSGCVKNFHPGYSIVLTPERIEKELKKGFPVKEKVDNITVTLRDPEVKINNNRIFIGTYLKSELWGFSVLRGTISVSGIPKFKESTRKLYIEAFQIEKLTVNGKKMEDENLKKVVSLFFKRVIGEIPVYTFKKKSKIKSIKVQNGKVYLKLGF